MPVYSISHCLELSKDQKKTLAEGITRAHCDITGAPENFVQIKFVKLAEGYLSFIDAFKFLLTQSDGWTSGEINDKFLLLDGVIREGRAKEVESKLLWSLNDLLVSVTKCERYMVSLTVFNRPHLIENGKLLPLA